MSYNESLNSNSNYPLMSQSQWDSAPFNYEDPPDLSFNVAVSYSISRDAVVTTDDYEYMGPEEDGWELSNPLEAYEYNYKSIKDILSFAQEAASHMLESKDYGIRTKKALENMVVSCKGWVIDESNAEQV